MPKNWNIHRLRPISAVESLAFSVSGLEGPTVMAVKKYDHSSCFVLSLHVSTDVFEVFISQVHFWSSDKPLLLFCLGHPPWMDRNTCNARSFQPMVCS